MAKVAVDFGTGNTVLAWFNETTQQAETIEIPGITTRMPYRLSPDEPERTVHVVPSMIYYAEREILIGDQVLSRGLAEHRDTIRWMKRKIADGSTRRVKTSQGHKSPEEAATDFLTLLLNYASDRLSFERDEFTFCAPTESFEVFEDWLRHTAEALRIQRLQILDEPTACVLGYHGAVRADDRFMVFDFGCGTLDVSIVRLDLASSAGNKAVQLGRAGMSLGGMDIDGWMAEDFCARHRLEGADRRELEALILRQAEAAKIQLSDPQQAEANITVLDNQGPRVRMLRTTYTRTCAACERGRPGEHSNPDTSCLGCLLVKNDFLKRVRETVERACENAAVKAGVRRSELTQALATGGTSLVPCVRDLLSAAFDRRAEYQNPFDAVARGACQGAVAPILQHDYAIESYHRQKGRYEFAPLFKTGTDYPTEPDAVRLWARGSVDGMTRIGIFIYEVSQMRAVSAPGSIWDEEGRLRGESRVQSEFKYVCLNRETPTFIVADPPVNLERDKKRFLCSFMVDGQRRLLVTVVDNLTGKTLLKQHPVVRL